MRVVGRDEDCPLPDHPVLAEVADALQAAGAWGVVMDARWELVYMTDQIRLSNGALDELVPLPLGTFYLAQDAIDLMLGWSAGAFSLAAYRRIVRAVGPWLVADDPRGVEGVRARMDERLIPELEGVVDEAPTSALTFTIPGMYTGIAAPLDVVVYAVRLRDASGAVVGTAMSNKPAAGMAILGALTAAGDLRHFKRIQRLGRADRRPAAILFADVEASSPLARSLSTASYFRLGRRLVRTADQCVVDAGGIVGRHAGDGVVAYFLAEDAGSESAAARACVEAMLALRGGIDEVAERSGLAAGQLVMRFGLHWGATLHIGQIVTAGRTEVNALGDEMNEAARIEASAVGGRALASKALVERLDARDAIAVGIDSSRVTYTPLADLPTSPEKARRDAPGIAVCEI